MIQRISHPACESPIFIIGSPRSGTSALAWALHQHPDLWTSRESDLFFNLFSNQQVRKAFETARDRPEGTWLAEQKVSQTEFLAYLGYGLNALWTERSGGKRWVDQTPLNTLIVDILADLFPGALFLHMVRDPRRVVHSMLNFRNMLSPEMQSAFEKAGQLVTWMTDLTEAAKTWSQFVEQAMTFAGKQPQRCLTVINESLAADAAGGFQKIHRFLGIEDCAATAKFFQNNRINSSFARTPEGQPGPRDSRPWQSWSNSQKSAFLDCVAPVLRKYPLYPEYDSPDFLDMTPAVRVASIPRPAELEPSKCETAARLIAFYLPQFHPIAENDAWWGKGFTEWTNVAKAQPQFPGHYQPHLPAHLGFCDLRVSEVREKQARMARAYGIEAFCYWHYWFDGKRLLERPFNEVLASDQPDFPFCLAWANETWSRRWLGEEKEILLKQTYSREDDVNHARWLACAFADRRYLRVRGRPVLLVYRPEHLPDARRTADVVRQESVRQGLPEPYLIGINSHGNNDWRNAGFDGVLDFMPHLGVLRDPLADGLKLCDYAHGCRLMRSATRTKESYPCVFVSWDNTPRRGENAIVFINATPEHFQRELSTAVQSVQGKPYEDRLVFVNAWNEWAEGNHLEPDQKHGLQYLEAVRRINLGEVAH